MPNKTSRNPDETRQKILEAAFWEIFRNGFQGASLDSILETTGVTKGALYHHFGSKAELGYAVVDEVIADAICGRWFKPLEDAKDPIVALKASIDRVKAEMPPEALKLGCPLHNLAQEMSPIDDEFRRRIERIIDKWRQTIVVAFARGQENGTVRRDINLENVANFIIATLEGGAGLTKTTQNHDQVFESIRAALFDYLDTLRPSRDKEKAA